VLDLLGMSERARFMGRSVLHAYPDAGRTFIATYQKLGYLTPDQLIIPGPGNKIEDWHLNQQQALTTPVIQPGPRVNRARRLSGDCTPRT